MQISFFLNHFFLYGVLYKVSSCAASCMPRARAAAFSSLLPNPPFHPRPPAFSHLTHCLCLSVVPVVFCSPVVAPLWRAAVPALRGCSDNIPRLRLPFFVFYFFCVHCRLGLLSGLRSLRGEARCTTRLWVFGSLASDWLLALPLQRPHIRLSTVQRNAYSMPCRANHFEPIGMASELLGAVLPILPSDPS